MLPDVKSGGLVNAILGNWQVAGIATYVSGAALQASYSRTSTSRARSPTACTIDTVHITGIAADRRHAGDHLRPEQNVPTGYMFNPACFAAPTRRRERELHLPVHQGHALQEPRPVALQELPDREQGPEAPVPDRPGLQRPQPSDVPYPDTTTNLTLHFTNGVLDNPDFGKLPRTTSSAAGSSSSPCGTPSRPKTRRTRGGRCLRAAPAVFFFFSRATRRRANPRAVRGPYNERTVRVAILSLSGLCAGVGGRTRARVRPGGRPGRGGAAVTRRALVPVMGLLLASAVPVPALQEPPPSSSGRSSASTPRSCCWTSSVRDKKGRTVRDLRPEEVAGLRGRA